MFKFKNFKILLLLMLFAFAGQDAWGYKGTWFNFRAKFTATGEGKVYGDFIKKENAVNKLHENVTERHRHDSGGTEDGDTYTGNEPIDLHLFAEASDGWEFVEWRDENNNKLSTSMPCDAQGNATSESTKYGYAVIENFKSKNVCGRNFSSSEGSADDHQTQHNTTYFDNYYNRVDARYVAVFRELESGPVVTAEPLDETLGLASFSPGDNQVGDIVTLATHPTGAKDKGYENKFLGWQHNGEFLRDDQGKIIRDNPYTFEVTEDNAGIYYAVYESGYLFYRLKNYVTKDYFDAISDNVTGNGLAAFKEALSNDFSMEDDGTCKAGSIYQIHTYKNTDGSGRIVYDLEVQNKHTKDYYDLPSIYIRLNQDVDKNAWNFSTSNDDGQGARLRVNEEGVQSVSSVLDDRSLWYIEPMDKDLETKENYFSLDPAKLVEVDGKYYTTLRTSWNILFNPDQMTPYIVKSVDETAGTFEMEPITGNIIPAGTPVIIETKSTDIEENRMVPTLTNAASGAVPSGNQLVSSTKYFPNQSTPVTNCKGLYKNANGQLAFGGNALSTVNGNEAYLSVTNEVAVLTETTLANLLEKGEIGPNYKITDLTCVYIQGNTLYCKDDNHALNKSVIAEGEEDYIKTYTALQNGDWDQSNWIAINLPEGSSIGTDYMEAIFDHRLNNVVGRLKSKVNPEFDATLKPTAGEKNTYDENTYITCNFSGEHQPGVVNGEDVNLFFVAPKPMEIAQVEWAMWDAASEMFIMPHAADDSRLHGAFSPNFSMLENVSNPNPQDGYGYHFPALIKLTEASSQSSAPILAAGNNSTWTVYPLEWNIDTPTAIDNLQAGKTVTRVVYYNMMGVESDVPHPGINIVEKRYSDGSRTTVKMMK